MKTKNTKFPKWFNPNNPPKFNLSKPSKKLKSREILIDGGNAIYHDRRIEHLKPNQFIEFEIDSDGEYTFSICETVEERPNPDYEEEMKEYNVAKKKHEEQLAEYNRLMVIWNEEQERNEYEKLKASKKRLEELEKKFGGKNNE